MKQRRLPRAGSSWLLPCLLTCVGQAHAALQLQPVEATLEPAEIVATRQLLDNAVRRLPPAWTDALDRRIDVEWRDDLPAQVHGRAQARRMLLDRALLDGWMQRPADAGDDDPATRAALAAVIHELAHFYDRTSQGGLSRDPRLLDLAGWQVRPLRFGLRTSHNAFSDRTPDPYELTSPVEFVAVNLEYFLLDPDYACRRPALQRYFATHFDMSPPAADCAPGLVYLQVDADAAPLVQLDPQRVYAVDYLLAEGNERPMSRWGHSMLRLVVCAPGRTRGPDCRLDLQHHLVLSFRAFVDDVQISSWRGLTGSYPSRLFALPLAQVIDEYTKVELRGLQSIPLQLDETEIAALLERAARLHWSYDGRYYFTSNNCAVETFKLLHDGVPRLAGEDLSSVTPTGLLRRLERAGVADTAVLDDRAEAMRLGYYFQAQDARYQEMFDIARKSLEMPQLRVHDWLELPPDERTPWLQRADLRTSAALLLLEQAAQRRHELLARDELKRRFLGRRADASDTQHDAGEHASHEPASQEPASHEPDPRTALRDVLRLEGFLSRPAALLPGTGYGLPQEAERASLTRDSADHIALWRQHKQELRTQAHQWLPPERQAALAAIQANIDTLGQRLRRLHGEQGGLQLR